MASKSKQMSTSIPAGQTIELGEGPRHVGITSQSSAYVTKVVPFASDDEEPPAYMTDFPLRPRDQHPRTRGLQDNNWRGFSVIPSVYSPPPSRHRDLSPNANTTREMPLRPNRRDDIELGREGVTLTSQVLLPVSANNRPTRMRSTGGGSAKNWFKNIRSPIGKFRVLSFIPSSLVC